MEKHIFEQSADILNVALDASASTIMAAYHSALARAAHATHLIHMAHDLLVTTTADFRLTAVRKHHAAIRFQDACRGLRNTEPTEEVQQRARAWDDRQREARLRNGRTPLERSIGYLHASMGHY
jgi:hypothetical protein